MKGMAYYIPADMQDTAQIDLCAYRCGLDLPLDHSWSLWIDHLPRELSRSAVACWEGGHDDSHDNN